jgi:hypothetical protein
MWKCNFCGKQVRPPSDKCPYGKHDTGLPTNVVRASNDEPTLLKRFENSARVSKDAARMLKAYKKIIGKNLAVSINIRPESLISLLYDDRVNYLNLHDNLRAGAISDVDRELVSKRTAIDHGVFGPDGVSLRYGAVNFHTIGLYSYGAVCVFLKPKQIRNRVSFLEENSFSYMDSAGNLNVPPGSRALWHTAPILAVVKHKDVLLARPRLTRDELAGLILSSTGSKKTDRYIEAQVHPPITRASIAEVIYSPSRHEPIKAKGIVGRVAEHNRVLAREYVSKSVGFLQDAIRLFLGGVKFTVVD